MSALLWARCRGRNGWDSPLDLPEDSAAEARNWHFYEGALGGKRGGSTSVAIVGVSGLNFLYRFLPGQDETAAEFFAVDNSATNQILRMAAASTFTALTLKDNIAASDTVISMATLNGKLYIAYDGNINRLHVFDPGLSTTLVRRAGLATPAAASVANTGAGTYPATLRYYRVQWRVKSGSIIKRQSVLGATVSFTPAGTGTHARVTQPAVANEGETHWVIYGSDDDVLYYELAEVVIATTTYDDNATPSEYGTSNDPAPDEGAFTPFPAVKYLATDGNRLLGFGVWETAAGSSLEPKAGRVYFGPVLDSDLTYGTDDDERISSTTEIEGWIDISRNSGSVDRGISPRPLNGVFYVFLSRGIHMLVPTESAFAPYRRVTLSSELGAVSNQSIVMGEDEQGRACCYFLDPELGPYRIGAGGLQRCGKDVQDLWDTVNHGATGVVAWGTYYKALNLVLFAVATGSSNDPDTILAFDVTEGRPGEDGIRGGWTVWDGDFASARTGCMFASTLGATMGRSLVPYTGNTKLLRYNPSATQDDATSFRGYVRSRAFVGDTLTKNKQVMRAYVLASAETGVTLTQGYVRNFGDETSRTDTALLTPVGSETKVLKKFESPDLADAYAFQVEIGDASAAATTFTLERWWTEFKEHDYRGA